jgi:hypothetical protein
VTHYLYAFLALDIARERAAEAERDLLISTLNGPSFFARLRRAAARGFAFVSRGFAGVVRALDERVADDLGRTLAPAK